MEVRKLIENYVPFNEQEENDKQQLLKWIDTNLDLWTRENEMAHWTSSAWVLDETHTKVLMAYHNIYNSWSWLGGHNDGEHDFIKVAEKEIKEESGVQHLKLLSDELFSLEILTVDGHIKKGEYVPSHLHLNLTYLFEADSYDPVFIKQDENSAVGWFEKEEAVQKSTEPWFQEHIYTKLNQKVDLWQKEGKI